jgi:hypothetical protein
MTVGILIAVLVGGGLIAFAIRASLGKRRSLREQHVPFSDTNAATGPIPGEPAIREVAEAIKRTALPPQIVADLAPARENSISSAKGQSRFTEFSELRPSAQPPRPPSEEIASDGGDSAAPAQKNPECADSSAAANSAAPVGCLARTELVPAEPLLAEAPPAPIISATELEPARSLATDGERVASACDTTLIENSAPAGPVWPDVMPCAAADIVPIALEPQSRVAVPAVVGAADALAEEGGSTVAIYRPPVRAPAESRKSATSRKSPSARVKQRSLDVQLQLLVSRTGDVSAALLFERPDDFPPTLAVKVRGQDVHLSAYGDGWYTTDGASQSSLAGALQDGLIASERVLGNTRTSWMLSAGREVYVVASRSGWGNYYSAPRLVLGSTQFVAAREHLLHQALQILAESCGKPVQLLEAEGALLQGWAILGPVAPLTPLAQIDGEHTFNLLRPMPELAILLEGGLCLRGAEWLEGFPPQIRVAGPIPQGEGVLIDNVAAGENCGTYKVAGCDLVGDHTIWCAGITRTYRISAAPALWESWRAHDQQKGTVCGAISEYRENNPDSQLMTVPRSNSVLIGANPGQVLECSGQAGEWTGIVPFTPVWALPANPFQCRKNAARLMLLSAMPIERLSGRTRRRRDVRAWCAAILDCKRKGLQLSAPGNASLWEEYVRAARRAWRSVR